MRIVSLEKYDEVRKKITIRMSIFSGALLGIPTFLFLVLGNFLAGVLVGVIVFGLMFGLVYVLRTMTEKSVARRRNKLEFHGEYIDVLYNREYGVLEFLDNAMVFHNLTPGAMEEKRMEIPYDMEIIAGEIEDRPREKLVYKEIPRGHVTINDPKIMRLFQFVFFDIEGAKDRIVEIVNKEMIYEE